MSIAIPSRGILNFKKIPVDCSSCTYYGDLSDISDDEKRALIKATTSHKLNEEWKMLMRIRELFSRHPNSKHKVILSCTSRLYSEDIEPEPDPEFEKDLENNPDIAEFINKTFFSLEGRLSFTEGEGEKLETFKNQKNITCPECGSVLVVPNTFYSMVGSYEDTIAYERSKRAGKLMRAQLAKMKAAEADMK